VIVDTSVLIAILLAEEGFENYLRVLQHAPLKRIAAPTLLEATMVILNRKKEEGPELLDDLLRTAQIETTAFTPDHAAVARQAFLRYGKGRHAAGLNFGDCISYATARLEAMPLLFKGNDFRQTDIEAAA